MARAGPLKGVWRRGVATNEVVMKESSLILPGLGSPVQILPQQQQAPLLSSASTLGSTILSFHFQPCLRVRQHSSHTIRHQRVLLLENKLRNGSPFVKHFPSSLHGDARVLKQQKPWAKEKFKDAFKLYPTREPTRILDVGSFKRLFNEFDRPPANYPSLVTQLPTALEPQFPSARIDQTKTRDFNALGNFDQSTSSSTLEVVQPGLKANSKPVTTVSTISGHRRSRRVEKITSDQRAPSPSNARPGPRFETSYVLGKRPLLGSSNGIASSNSNQNSSKQMEAGLESKIVISNQTLRRSPDGDPHLLSNSHATHMSFRKSGTRGEPASIVVDQAKCFQNGARPALNNCRIPASSIMGSVRQTSGVAKFDNPSLERVQQEIDELDDQWRLQKMAAELYRREAQSEQPKYKGEAESFASSQGARRHGNSVPQLEAPYPETRAGAPKWRETSNMIEQNRNPSHQFVIDIESGQQNTDSLKVKFEGEADMNANLARSITANDARQRAKNRLQSPANYGSRDWSPDTAPANGSTLMHSAATMSEAIAVLHNRRQRGITTTSDTYAKVLQMCLKQKDLSAAKQVHDCIIDSRMDKNLYVANTLLNVYIWCGGLLDARRVFDELEEKSVITWNTMIAGYARNHDTESALELFKLMRQDGALPNEVTYLCILKACASPLALTWGKQLQQCLRQAGFESDVRVGTALLQMYAKCGCITEARGVFEKLNNRNLITWNIMIGAYAESGRGVEAYRLFLEMRREGFEPDLVTYMNILNASASAGASDWVKEVHGHASEAGLETDLRVGAALVHMYAKSGSIDDARLVFDRLEKRDVVTWNIMIGGLAQHGCGHEALELFRKMNADLVKPNRTTFSAVLSACCHAGLLDDGRRLFLAMKQAYGIEPDIVHYTCMVDLLGRAGHLEEAKVFISDMPVAPDDVLWKALLGACRTHGNVELGELAAKELFKLEPSDDAGYVLLSNIYAAAGKWEKVSLVRIMMQQRGVRKEPGRSWIEVDNKIHEFVVGDTSHPEANAIYVELDKLTEKLKAEGYIPDTRLVLHDINEEDKEVALCSHSEKLAIAYGLMHIPRGEPIRVRKNLRVCPDCHTATKFISKVTGRQIIARDTNRFHHFKDGACSCGDYW